MAQKIPDQVLLLMAENFRMLSEPTRLMILRTLMTEGELSVTQIVEQIGSTQANVSKHLKQLADAGLVARRKVGLNVCELDSIGSHDQSWRDSYRQVGVAQGRVCLSLREFGGGLVMSADGNRQRIGTSTSQKSPARKITAPGRTTGCRGTARPSDDACEADPRT